MTKIYITKKEWRHGLGGTGKIIIDLTSKKNELFYGEQDENGNMIYYPKSGGYPVWERDYGNDNPNSFYFVDEYFKLIGESEHSKDYFMNPIYTQEDMDNA